MSLQRWIQQYLDEEAPKSKSLIVTVFGDALLPRVDRIWLGTLIELMAPFGINERLVRTSCFRLIDEGWFAARREGRRSEYALTGTGRRRIELAYERVYTPPVTDWDGRWTLVIVPRASEAGVNRVELRRELEWQGYAQLTPGVMIHPVGNAAALRALLAERALGDRVVVLRAGELPGFEGEARDTLAQCWNLDEIIERYRRFLSRFETLRALLERVSLAPAQAFLLQTLLIHSFRRATLHDPRLPADMLPADWPGTAAYALCRALYAQTVAGAQAHVAASLAAPAAESAAAPALDAGMLAARFGGIGVSLAD